jgi:cob(I)alamin adenosyltransferase
MNGKSPNKIKMPRISTCTMKIYTKTGDDGTTGLIGNKRVKKSNPRITAYGMVDELNASIGIILSSKLGKDIRDLLTKIQNDLFVVGADLANPNLNSKLNRVTSEMVLFLEKEIDRLEEKLSPITFFILPGGDLVASQVHLARAMCRRAEVNVVNLSEVDKINNECLVYLNRLSDLLFVIARTINKRKKISDVAWKK